MGFTLTLANEFRYKVELFKILSCLIFSLVLILIQSHVVFSAEDIPELIAQGEAALTRKDYDQALSTAKRILKEDPRNLIGYRFALIYCTMANRELDFERILREAIRLGVSPAWVNRLAAELLYRSYRPRNSYEKLCEYELKWSEAYDRSH